MNGDGIMINRGSLKQLAKNQLRGNWGSGVLATLLFLVVSAPAVLIGLIPVIGGALTILFTAPLTIGMLITYLNLTKNVSQLNPSDLFKGFNIYGKSVGIVLWYSLWTFLWSLLFVIPGIIKGFAYSQAMYIIADNPNVKVRDALKISMKMTKGYKFDIFIMFLSFIGWQILNMLTFGIGTLWLVPYMNTTLANMYLQLKKMSIKSGVCTDDEFNGRVSLT